MHVPERDWIWFGSTTAPCALVSRVELISLLKGRRSWPVCVSKWSIALPLYAAGRSMCDESLTSPGENSRNYFLKMRLLQSTGMSFPLSVLLNSWLVAGSSWVQCSVFLIFCASRVSKSHSYKGSFLCRSDTCAVTVVPLLVANAHSFFRSRTIREICLRSHVTSQIWRSCMLNGPHNECMV